VEIIDRKLWERELTAHMRRHAAELRNSAHAPPKSGVWVSPRQIYLWTILIMIIIQYGMGDRPVHPLNRVLVGGREWH
jgi:hypothetical protein